MVHLDDIPTALDQGSGRLVATTVAGMVVEFDLLTGATIRATELTIGNTRVTPLSLAITKDGRYAIGLLDGRILLVDRQLQDSPTQVA